MPVLNILKYPDPLLKKVSSVVREMSPEVSSFIRDLLDTMRASPAAVGIAAPQAGVLLNIIIIDVTPKHPGQGLTVMINPEIISSTGLRTGREGCLSIPEYTANIHRAQSVTVKGLTPSMQEIIIESSDFEAVAFQHELDHLNGILFIDRISNMKRDLFKRKSKGQASGNPSS
ncbi:MAG: peptide deformylase [Deltaproteobacteria bacterium]|nr:peptide deformylase [Deltaproteobacteria bacterium]